MNIKVLPIENLVNWKLMKTIGRLSRNKNKRGEFVETYFRVKFKIDISIYCSCE